jgi:hypothetical protein
VRTTAIQPQVTVTLDGTGSGQASMTPPSGCMWQLTLAAISTTSVVAASQCFLYLGSSSGPLNLVDSTYLGNSASSGKVAGAPFYHGMYLWAVWSGADAGCMATLQAYGQQSTGYRRAAA